MEPTLNSESNWKNLHFQIPNDKNGEDIKLNGSNNERPTSLSNLNYEKNEKTALLDSPTGARPKISRPKNESSSIVGKYLGKKSKSECDEGILVDIGINSYKRYECLVCTKVISIFK